MRFFLRTALLIDILLSIISCTSAPPGPQQVATFTPTSSSRQPSPPATFTPTPIVANSTNVGLVPTDCPPSSSPRTISPDMGPAVGASPVWASGFGTGTYPTAHLQDDRYSPHEGWPWKLAREVGPSYQKPVTIRAGMLHTGKLLSFQMSPDDFVTTVPTLDPKHPGHPSSQLGPDWNEWGSYLFLPGAGCYYLEATWPQGHWLIYFAAGL